jgi:hypothetical protein
VKDGAVLQDSSPSPSPGSSFHRGPGSKAQLHVGSESGDIAGILERVEMSGLDGRPDIIVMDEEGTCPAVASKEPVIHVGNCRQARR